MSFKHLILLGLFFTTQCRTIEAPQDLGYSYFPLQEGKYWIYAMDSTAYDPFSGVPRQTEYYVKEQIVSSTADPEGNLVYHLFHYYSFDSSALAQPQSESGWTYYKRSTIQRNEIGAEQQLNDRRFTLLIFPVNDYKSWDRNAFNTLEEDKVRYEDKTLPTTINGMAYNNTVKITDKRIKDIISHREGLEIYAFGTGLIYREKINTETQNDITKGSQYSKTLIDTNW